MLTVVVAVVVVVAMVVVATTELRELRFCTPERAGSAPCLDHLLGA